MATQHMPERKRQLAEGKKEEKFDFNPFSSLEQAPDADIRYEKSRAGAYFRWEGTDESTAILESISIHSAEGRAVIQFFCNLGDDVNISSGPAPFHITRQQAQRFLEKVRNHNQTRQIISQLLQSNGKPISVENIVVYIRKTDVYKSEDCIQVSVGHESIKELLRPLFT